MGLVTSDIACFTMRCFRSSVKIRAAISADAVSWLVGSEIGMYFKYPNFIVINQQRPDDAMGYLI